MVERRAATTREEPRLSGVFRVALRHDRGPVLTVGGDRG